MTALREPRKCMSVCVTDLPKETFRPPSRKPAPRTFMPFINPAAAKNRNAANAPSISKECSNKRSATDVYLAHPATRQPGETAGRSGEKIGKRDAANASPTEKTARSRQIAAATSPCIEAHPWEFMGTYPLALSAQTVSLPTKGHQNPFKITDSPLEPL